MKKKISYITSLVLILLTAASTWSYYCLNPSSDRVNKAKANIKVYSHYELIQNGKTILRFDEDTTTLAANFMNRWALIPSCEGRLAACYNNSISRNHYLGKDADSIFKEKVDSLDSLYRDSKWKVGELNYYIHSHSVLDAGYNSICAYTQHELELRDSAKKLIDSLKHVQKKGHFKLKRSISYQAYYRDENGKWKSQACKLIKQ